MIKMSMNFKETKEEYTVVFGVRKVKEEIIKVYNNLKN